VSDGDEPPLTLRMTLSQTAHPRSLHRLVERSRSAAGEEGDLTASHEFGC